MGVMVLPSGWRNHSISVRHAFYCMERGSRNDFDFASPFPPHFDIRHILCRLTNAKRQRLLMSNKIT